MALNGKLNLTNIFHDHYTATVKCKIWSIESSRSNICFVYFLNPISYPIMKFEPCLTLLLGLAVGKFKVT